MIKPDFMQGSVVRVLVPLAMPGLLDYRLPAGETADVGCWVAIPVGKKDVHGVVAEVLESSPFANLKEAKVLGDVPPLSAQMLAFYRWVARYTLSAPGEPLRVALPRAHVPEPLKRARKSDDEAMGVGRAVTLNPAQADAARVLQAAMGRFGVFLLDGVTGSGKTEVYFDVVQHLRAGVGQVLVLVPEIALTPQWLARFEARFGQKPDVWHSGLADGARRNTWWRVAKGEARVVVGARSALFLPFTDLRFVVVDEEHEPSYKQDEAFRYHGRDCAVQLAHTWQAPVVLASATPSLESWQRTLEGKYTRLVLPSRHGGAGMAPLHMIDLRKEGMAKQTYVSGTLQRAVADTLAKGEQSLLFLNRRGNAPVLLCTACGTRRDCPRCDATLVVHGDKLQCHHCGLTEVFPDECPKCGEAALRAYGPGTRRVVSEVQGMFPQARIVVADSDAVGTTNQLSEMVKAVEAREVDIIVGTQMVTKGHHFPHLTCVGVIDADMGLAHGDLRAAERTFQLLTQVAGRAGRGEAAGAVWVQTHDPAQPLFQALLKNDRDGFYAAELEARKAWGDPPFGRMVALIVDGLDEKDVVKGARMLAQGLKAPEGVRVLGPAPAPVAKVRDRHRWRLLVKGNRALQPLVKAWVEQTPLPRGVRVVVDVDPVSFY